MAKKLNTATAPIKAKDNGSHSEESGLKIGQAPVAATPIAIGWRDLEKTHAEKEPTTGLLGDLCSLLDSSIHAHEDPEQFVGKLQSLLEPSMVNAMSDACNGAEGFVTALQFFWNSCKDNPTNSEALLSTMAMTEYTVKRLGRQAFKHKSTILEMGGRLGERTPASMIFRYGFDAANELASENKESLMNHVGTDLGVTSPMAYTEIPKLGSIGGSIAAMAASSIRTIGAQAAAIMRSNSKLVDLPPRSTIAPESLVPGARERAILAETALHGIMRLDKNVLKHHQVFDKIRAIVKPLVSTIARADPMLSSIMQPTIAKVALASLIQSNPSTDIPQDKLDTSQNAPDAPEFTSDVSQDTTAAPRSPSPNPYLLAYKPNIGVTTRNAPSAGNNVDTTTPAQTWTDDNSSFEEPVKAFIEALIAANPYFEKGLPDMVEQGMQVGEGAFANATLFGLPLLLDGGLESEYYEQHTESAVPVTGLAQHAILAEAALQVMLKLPVDLIKSVETPDMRPMVDAFNAEGLSDREGKADKSLSHLPQQTPMGFGAAGALPSGAGSIAISAASLRSRWTTPSLMLKLKERELELKQQELESIKAQLEITKIGRNMDAAINKKEQPYKDVKYWDSHGYLIDPKAGGGDGGHGLGGAGGAEQHSSGAAALRGGTEYGSAPHDRGAEHGAPPRGGGYDGTAVTEQHHEPKEHESHVEHPGLSSNGHLGEQHSPAGPSAKARGKIPIPTSKSKPAHLMQTKKSPLCTKPAAAELRTEPKGHDAELKEMKAQTVKAKETREKEKEEKAKETQQKVKEKKANEGQEEKEEEEKDKVEEAKKATPKPHKADPTRPTKASAAKATKPAKTSGKSGKKYGHAEGLLHENVDDESQLARIS